MPRFQVTLHKFLHHKVDEWGNQYPLHNLSHYTYAPPFEPESHHFNRVASGLVYAERCISSSDVEFGRVVFLELSESKFDEKTPTVTCCPVLPTNYPTGNQVRGLRSGSMLDVFYGVGIYRNTTTDKHHKRVFMGAVGRDDLSTRPRPPHRKNALVLDMNGPFCWLFGWWRYLIQQIPHVDPSEEYTPLGEKVQYEPYASQHLINACSHFAQLRRWWENAPQVVVEYHQSLYQRDKAIRNALLGHVALHHYSRPFGQGLDIVFNMGEAHTLANSAWWLGYQKFLQPSLPADVMLNVNTKLQPQYWQGDFEGKMTVKREAPRVRQVLNRAFQLHQNYCTRSTGYPNLSLARLQELAWPGNSPDGISIAWQHNGVWHRFPDTLLGYVPNGFGYSLPYYFHVKFYRFMESLFEEYESAFHLGISCCNVLDQIIAAGNRRELVEPFPLSSAPHEEQFGETVNTYPREFEWVNYQAIQALTKPPYLQYLPEHLTLTPITWIKTPFPKRVPKRKDGLPAWWQGVPPEPDYQGAYEELGEFADEVYGDIDDGARKIYDSRAGRDVRAFLGWD